MKDKIIKLDIVDIDLEEKTTFTFNLGFFSSYEKAENVMKNIDKAKEETIFITQEIIIDVIESVEDFIFYTTRQYKWVNNELKMIHETPSDFNGYTDKLKECTYKKGDIIDYISFDGRIHTAIVDSVPPQYSEDKKNLYDFFDDSYLVYHLGEGDTHQHVNTTNIIGFSEIGPDVFKAYRDKLKERDKANGK